MGIKEKIIANLGKKSEAVWDLILKSCGITEEDVCLDTIEGYEFRAKDIDNGKYRYLLIEGYNLYEGFYSHIYSEKEIGNFREMIEEYFGDCNGTEEMLLIDLKELKAYRLWKEVKYPCEEITL